MGPAGQALSTQDYIRICWGGGVQGDCILLCTFDFLALLLILKLVYLFCRMDMYTCTHRDRDMQTDRRTDRQTAEARLPSDDGSCVAEILKLH